MFGVRWHILNHLLHHTIWWVQYRMIKWRVPVRKMYLRRNLSILNVGFVNQRKSIKLQKTLWIGIYSLWVLQEVLFQRGGAVSQVCSYITFPGMRTFNTESDYIHKVFMPAPQHTSSLMDKEDKFNTIWDTGASVSITPNSCNFIEFNTDVENWYLEEVSKDIKVEGQGIVQWNMVDVNGKVRKMKVKAMYVPTCNLRLLRPHSLTKSILMKPWALWQKELCCQDL